MPRATVHDRYLANDKGDRMQAIVEQAGFYGPLVLNSIKALIVLVIGWTVAGAVARYVRRRVNASEEIDNTIGNFIASMVRWVLLAIVAVAILNMYGIQATSLVAMMGAATLAIGLALQGTLGNLAAGFMLVLFRPYRLGQYVDIGGTSGTVKDLNLFVTELATPDNVQIIVPNGQAWGSIITNYSHHNTRRVQLVFGIDYNDDSDRAIELILEWARNEPRIMSDPEPWARVTALGASSVDITARVWAKSEDFWDVQFAMTKGIKDVFDGAGITIPYPHTVMVQKNG